LPAPDIEIGLRHPVNCMMPWNITGICDPVHNRREKFLAALLRLAAYRRDVSANGAGTGLAP